MQNRYDMIGMEFEGSTMYQSSLTFVDLGSFLEIDLLISEEDKDY